MGSLITNGTNMPDKQDNINKLLEETDSDTIKQYLNMFNVYHMKRTAARMDAVDDTMDTIVLRIGDMIRNGEIDSAKDLVNCLNALSAISEKSGQAINGVQEVPAITINQQNNVVVSEEFTKEAKERVMSAVNSILNSIQNPLESVQQPSEQEE